ncbi:hypothetical protein, partial [Micromonospora sp. ATA51]|uniref:hypothetical protein n=1 Tax=Micromonospora sp. ATA51 TaxID=2806098 RepID=UPI001EE424F9
MVEPDRGGPGADQVGSTGRPLPGQRGDRQRHRRERGSEQHPAQLRAAAGQQPPSSQPAPAANG